MISRVEASVMSGYLSGKRVFYATRAGASLSPGATGQAAKLGIACCVPQRTHQIRSADAKRVREAALAESDRREAGRMRRARRDSVGLSARSKTRHHFGALLIERLSSAVNFNLKTKKQHDDEARCAIAHAIAAAWARRDFLGDYGSWPKRGNP
jgi:hypothetical protein